MHIAIRNPQMWFDSTRRRVFIMEKKIIGILLLAVVLAMLYKLIGILPTLFLLAVVMLVRMNNEDNEDKRL
jgi:hypothetical protein